MVFGRDFPGFAITGAEIPSSLYRECFWFRVALKKQKTSLDHLQGIKIKTPKAQATVVYQTAIEIKKMLYTILLTAHFGLFAKYGSMLSIQGTSSFSKKCSPLLALRLNLTANVVAMAMDF